ncbi:toxin glutamine deamidase domain-containing protein [Actinokineospora pegani]|uniref:toxin glutamine deamidase domain-containing protein n=1 Tax=Actinokineospora pegani TaxID=2654637 RepID=UPI0012E9FABC|nr:toxin glutamine deamidase domain-containing protein [Actinokineospora pegani]
MTANALRLRDRSPAMAGVSDAGAMALHVYTEHDVFDHVNRAMRVGPVERSFNFEKMTLANRAIVSAINELPPRALSMVRGVNSSQGVEGARLIAAQYEVGKTTVEPALVSATIKGDGVESSQFGKAVEIHIESKTARDIQALSSKPGEREGISKPGSQWHTVDKQVFDEGTAQERTVIRVKEVVPGDPEYLAKPEADAELARRREVNKVEAARREAEAAKKNGAGGAETGIAGALAGVPGPVEPDRSATDRTPEKPDTPRRTPSLTDRLDQSDPEPVRESPRPDHADANTRPPVSDTPTPLGHHGTDGRPTSSDATPETSTPPHRTNTTNTPETPTQHTTDTRPPETPTRHNAHTDTPPTTPKAPTPPHHTNTPGTPTRNSTDTRPPSPETPARRTDTETPTQLSSNTRPPLPGTPTRHNGHTEAPTPPRHTAPPSTNTPGTAPPHNSGTRPPEPRHTSPDHTRPTTPAGAGHPTGQSTPFGRTAPQTAALNRPGHTAHLPHNPHNHPPEDPQRLPHRQAAGDLTQLREVAIGPSRDWTRLARPTRPPFEAAIHAGSAHPFDGARYLADEHPELARVNPHFRHPHGYANGFHTNCTRATTASALRHAGIDTAAGPVLPRDLEAHGTLEYVQSRLGGQWQEHRDFDSVIREMRTRPFASRAVVAIEFRGSDGATYKHVADVVHTRHGVAFVDGQSNRLLHLPDNAHRVRLLPYDLAEVARRHQAQGAGGPEPHAQRGHGFGSTDQPGQPTGDAAARRRVPSIEEVHEYLRRADVVAAMAEADKASQRDESAKVALRTNGEDHREHVGRAIAILLPRHPELLGTMQAVPFLERSLLERPQALANVLRYPEAVTILGECVDELLHHPGGVEALVESVTGPGSPRPADLTPEQRSVSDTVRQTMADLRTDDVVQSGFDPSRRDDESYRRSYMDSLFEGWPEKQAMLHSLAEEVAQVSDGTAHSRHSEKSHRRAWDKASAPGKTPADLTDLVGSKVQFHTLGDAYRGLAKLVEITERPNSPYQIVSFEDRFRAPQSSGYRDLQLSVRMTLPDGGTHVGELRLHLHAIDEVAKYEHALYEVRRDIKAMAEERVATENAGRAPADRLPVRMTPEEQALIRSILGRERELFGAAFGEAGGTIEGGGT